MTSFANAIMSDQAKKLGEQRLHYHIKKWQRRDNLIFYDISENVTLVQLIENVGNVNYAVNIVGY